MLKRTLLAISIAAAMSAAGAADTNAGTDTLRKTLTERMPGMQIGAIAKLPQADLYEVVVNGINIFYTDAKGEVGFFGRMVDLKTRKNITEQRAQEVSRVDFSALPLDKAIVKVKGDGSRKLAVFSDPDCPYCQQLEKELALLNDVTVYTFLFPIPEIHPGADHKSNAVWCADDRAKAWDDLMLRGIEPKAAKEGCEAPLKAVAEVAQKSWITGTPGIVFADGRLHPGAATVRELEQKLSAGTLKSIK